MLTMGLARSVEDEAASRRGMRLGLDEAVTGAVDDGVNAGEALAWPDRAGEAEVCGRGDVAGDAVNGHGRHLAGPGAVADAGPFPAGSRRIPWEQSEGERDPRTRSRGRLLLTEEKTECSESLESDGKR